MAQAPRLPPSFETADAPPPRDEGPELLRRLALRRRPLLRPIVCLLLGGLQRIQRLEAGRHRAVRASENLMVLDVERAQPALLAHGDRNEIADLDQFRLTEVLVQPRPDLVRRRQV